MASKKYAAHVRAGALVLASIYTMAAQGAPALVVGDGAAISVKSPTQYVTSSLMSTLSMTADGYILCANVDIGGGISAGAVSFAPRRDGWSLPTASDVRAVSYNGGTFYVNKSPGSLSLATTLTCQIRDGQGRMLSSPYSAHGDRLFADSFDLDADALQRSYLANWAPSPEIGFDWGVPDWFGVPNDSCVWGTNPNYAPHQDVPQVVESTLCAAATGVRSVTSSQNDVRYGDRASTMLANTTSGGNYIYLARIDLRLGAQLPADLPNSHFVSTSESMSAPNSVDSPSVVDVAIRDAYDSDFLAPGATYCYLNELPVDKMDGSGNLKDDVCSSSHKYYVGTLSSASNNGNLYERISLVPYGAQRIQSLFVAVVRQLRPQGQYVERCQPAAAIAVLPNPDFEPSEGGDTFNGDDVVYGFYNGETFSWMKTPCS